MMRRILCLKSVLAALLFAVSTIVYAQAFNPLGNGTNNTQESGPKTITSNSMDLNMQTNVAVMTGNVIYDDNQAHITCNKMTVYLLKDTKDAKDAKDAKTNNESGKIKKIVCDGNVIMTRKLLNKEDLKGGAQKATSGHAVFNLPKNEIILTINPVLYKGGTKITGKKITYWTDTGRLMVGSGKEEPSKLFIDSNKKSGGINI